MTSDTGSGPTAFASASYTAAGQLYQLSYGGMTETRTYNSMMQLISQSVPGYLSMAYNYSTTGHNNGRIVSSSDGITGENTNYTYDALNRLTNASNSQWSESYGYDGFGNLTSKTGSGGSPNAAPSMSVSYNANNQQTAGVSYDANGNTGGRVFNDRLAELPRIVHLPANEAKHEFVLGLKQARRIDDVGLLYGIQDVGDRYSRRDQLAGLRSYFDVGHLVALHHHVADTIHAIERGLQIVGRNLP